MNNSTMLFALTDLIDNKTMLLILMVVLIAFIVLLAVLGIVFIIALRKRAPVVKVVMAPNLAEEEDSEEEQQEQEDITEIFTHEAPEEGVLEESNALVVSNNAVQPLGQPVPGAVIIPEEPDEVDDEEDGPQFVTEGQERVRYSRSFLAKVCQLKDETKEWYSQIKNDILSYERVKARMSWRKETFRIGRMTVARLAIRGKTLCLMLAVEPAGYAGTKYSVEDVSNVVATSDTPTLYRIKSPRKLKYAKEMVAGLMKEIKIYKDPRYEAKDFFLPYEGDVALMHRGLVKRIVTGTTRTFKIEEIDPSQIIDVEPEREEITIEPAVEEAQPEKAPKQSKRSKKVVDEAAATEASDAKSDDDNA